MSKQPMPKQVMPIITVDSVDEVRDFYVEKLGFEQVMGVLGEVEDVEAYHARVNKKAVKITDGLTLQWWGDRTFKVMDLCGYELWFYQTVGEPKPPQGMKLV